MSNDVKLNLLQKLAKIKELADVAEKENEGYKYTYVDLTSILANVTAGMKRYQVSLLPMFVPGTTTVEQNVTRTTKTGKNNVAYEQVATEMMVKSQMIYRWIDNEDPESYLDIPWFIVGAQADPSQAMGAGLTYAMRQFLCNFFQIAQVDDDVDQYRKKQKEAEDREDKLILGSIIEEIDGIVKSYLDAHKDKRDFVLSFMKKYEKSGNYNKIKEIDKAAACLAGFKEIVSKIESDNKEEVLEIEEKKDKKAVKAAKTAKKEVE